MNKIERAREIFLELETKKGNTYEKNCRNIEIAYRILSSKIH
ncbi:MAG: hypothetical protein WC260_01285 [Candidatus Pacearchaeota archaeon]